MFQRKDEDERVVVRTRKSSIEENRMKTFSDVDLTELADWAEQQERAEVNPDAKKAYGAMRQGADWLLRFRVKQRQKELEAAGKDMRPVGKAS